MSSSAQESNLWVEPLLRRPGFLWRGLSPVARSEREQVQLDASWWKDESPYQTIS